MTIFEVAHWSGAVPLLLLLALQLAGRRAPGPYWWVASGFAVSVFGDGIQKLTGGGSDVTFYYTPPQIALVLCAFQPGIIPKALILAFVAVAGWVSAHTTTAPAEWMLTVVGGLTIAIAAFYARTLRAPLWVYFLAGMLAYLWMFPVIGTEAIYPRWLAYQACRWTAFALFSFDLYRERRAWTP